MRRKLFWLAVLTVIAFLSGCPSLSHKPPVLNIPDQTVVQGSLLELHLPCYVIAKDAEGVTFMEGSALVFLRSQLPQSTTKYHFQPVQLMQDRRRAPDLLLTGQLSRSKHHLMKNGISLIGQKNRQELVMNQNTCSRLLTTGTLRQTLL